MRSVRHLGLSLLNGLFLTLAMACGSGGGGGSTPAIQPPTALTYTTATAVYTVGAAITANSPSSSGGAVTSYGVSPALPAGLSLSATSGVISGTPTAIAALSTYTLTASNSAGSTTATLSITVNEVAPAGLTYTTTAATYTVGVPITANSPTSSGGAVSTYSVSPALPAGLSLSTTTGIISGTPTAATASATYTVTATNTGGSATKDLTITVSGVAPANLTYTLTTAAYTKGVAITANSPSSSGGAVVSYSVSPALPTGLSLSTTTGVMTGTPTAVTASATYTVTATNAGGNATKALTIAVNDLAPASLSYTLISATYTKGVAITSNSPSSSGGAVISYSVSPALPTGLSLSTTTGVITGTPTAVAATATYTVTATNTGGNATKALTISVNDVAPASLSYSLITATYTKGVAIPSNSPSSSGGAVASYGVSPALPAGLNLSTITGVITGTPTAITASGTYTVTATNTGGSTTKDLTITVNDAAPTGLAYSLITAIYTKGLPVATNTPSSSGGTVVLYSVSPVLPAGLSLDTSMGIITGTPTAITGSGTYTVTATNTGGSTTKDLTITVNDAAPTSLAYTLATAVYTKGVVTALNSPSNSGGAVVSYSVSPALPAGLSLDTTTGIITGTPTAITGSGTYTVTATNTGGSTTKDLTITVNDAAPTSLAYTLVTAIYTKGVVVASNAPSNSGGTVVSYGVSPALPSGLSLDTTTGVITGTPTAIVGSGTYTVTATNTGGSTTKDLTITVNDAAPTSLAYTLATAIYTKNVVIASNAPSNSGGTVVSYGVSPALPTGLSLDTTTGIISGTPTAITALATYTVTATNTGGNTTKALTITVNDAAPTSLGYTLTTAIYTKDVVIASNSPSSSGGVVVSYGVSPALPTGLILDPTTGIISGTPTAITASAPYTVTATNTGGNATKVLTITVSGAATHFSVTGFPTSTTSAVAHTVTVTALDTANNTATGYAGIVLFTSTDGAAVLPPNGFLTNGVGIFSATLNTAGSQSITATDGSITGTQSGISVAAALVAAPSGYLVLPTIVHPSDTWMKASVTPQTGSMTYLWTTPSGGGTISSGQGTDTVEFTAPATGSFTVNANVQNTLSANIDLHRTVTVNTANSWLAKDGEASNREFATATVLPSGLVLVTGGLSVDYARLATAELYNPTTGLWVRTGDMHEARSKHTATLLQNGKVLVAGGLNASNYPLATAEIYDPATGLWTTTGGLATLRYNHTATLLSNGTVLVTGGTTNTAPTAVVEVYDPVATTWTTLAAMGTARSKHTATLLGNGTILIAGGTTTALATDVTTITELYTPAAGGSTVASGPLHAGRSNHTATLLNDGTTVLLAGGTVDGSTPLATSETWSAGTWTVATNMTTARMNHTATLLGNGKVLVVGDQAGSVQPYLSTTEFYSGGTWTATSAGLGTPRTNHTAALLNDGKVLVAGGTWNYIPNSSRYALTSSELFNPTTSTWAVTGSRVPVRYAHTATLLDDGTVLVAGGHDYAGTLNSSMIYTPGTGVWAVTQTAGNTPTTLNNARRNNTATKLASGKVLVAGGVGTGGILATAELYDSSLGTWTLAVSMAFERYNHTATLLSNGKVLVTGGIAVDGSSILNTVEIYDPTGNSWTTVTPMATARAGHTATLIAGGKVLVTGGTNFLDNLDIKSVEIFDPTANSGTGSWTTSTPNMGIARHGHTATLIAGGKVLVNGGQNTGGALATAEIFDPAAAAGVGTWTATADMTGSGPSAASYGHTATLLPSGKVMVTGGLNGNNGLRSTAQTYDPGTGTWTAVAPMIGARSSHTATLLSDGTVLVAFGSGGDTSTEVYKP